MDRFEGKKYKERCETSRYDERYRDNNDVELQNLTNKSDRKSEVKKGHTGQDWWTCKTKGVKSSEYVEIGSQRGTAQGTRDVQVSMGYDREHSQDESDVLDVNEIFKQIGTLVQVQGDLVDQIETNLIGADYVEEDDVELGKPVTYQKSSRIKLFILVILCLIIAAVIAIILGVALSKH
ncbi:syntaxin-12-like [Watersipora subatra]|uniref:syntaxin-12-like n=1 Tax=Watersipora subatra TaxID=2589382 RepID=UPI00355C023C